VRAQQHQRPPRTPLGRELAVLYWRTLAEIVRNPTLLAMHCAMALVMGCLCGGIFLHISNDIAGAQNRLGARACCTSPAWQCFVKARRRCLGSMRGFCVAEGSQQAAVERERA
jgi:hypothetical protein